MFESRKHYGHLLRGFDPDYCEGCQAERGESDAAGAATHPEPGPTQTTEGGAVWETGTSPAAADLCECGAPIRDGVCTMPEYWGRSVLDDPRIQAEQYARNDDANRAFDRVAPTPPIYIGPRWPWIPAAFVTQAAEILAAAMRRRHRQASQTSLGHLP